MKVDLVDYMGDDLMVVNAARVSFNKESSYEWSHAQGESPEMVLREGDEKLLSYLAKNGHWTPFSHPTICVRVKAPIFVARQLFKHKVGMTENEVSRRYVSDDPELFFPEKWRLAPTGGAKQGSSDEAPEDLQAWADQQTSYVYSECEKLYRTMVDVGIAPEQARIILPQAMYTEWYWTGSLASFARIYKLRIDPHAQKESQEIARQINEIVSPLFPVSWEALTC